MSGKRAADKQLTDRNWDDEDRDDEPSQNGEFAQAPAAEIATRKIRGLPQRKGAKTTAAADAPAPSKPLFGGFGAPTNPFGANPTSATNGQATDAAQAKPNPFATLSFGFAAPANNAAPSTLPAAPTFSFGASATTKPAATDADAAKPATTFAGFGASAAPTQSKSQDSSALKYFTALRGLNVSLVEALTAEVDRDPFINLATSSAGLDKIKQKYLEHRNKIEQEYKKTGGKSDAASSTASAASTSAPASTAPGTSAASQPATTSFAFASATSAPQSKPTTAFSFSASTTPPKASEPAKAEDKPKADDKTAPAFAPPAPPSSFTFGGKPVATPPVSSESAKPVSGGFVFNPSAPKDPYQEESKFKLPAAAPAPAPAPAPAKEASPEPAASKPSGLNVAATKFQPTAPSPLRFGVSGSSPTKTEDATNDEGKKPAGFSFGATFGAFAKGESGKKNADEQKTAGEKKESAPAATTTFAFGQPAKSESTASAPAPSAPAATFSFGSSTTAKPSSGVSFGAFGSAATSTPTKPLQLKPQSSPPLATAFGGSSPPAFAFGAALGTKKESSTAFKPSPGFSFGVPSGGASPGFGFGASSSSTSTGFSFGSTASNAATAGSENTSRAQSVAASDTAPSTVDGGEGEPASSTADDDGAAWSSGLFGQGAGEEGESVLHQVKTKVYVLAKEGAQEKGVGVLSIKEKDGDNGKKVRRVLTRNEGNNSVMMNFLIQPSMQPKIEKTFVTILGFEGSEPTMYRLRVKTKEMAEELYQRLVDATKQA
ncbi:hypothetical protein ACM66B_005384 [Microbotryomycetes sp. NB124-2]